MIKIYTHLCMIFIFSIISIPSIAAPFCLTIQDGISPECIYYDISQCRRDANTMRGRCTVDTNYMQSVMQFRLFGSGRFCFVDSQYFTACMYQTREDCLMEISRGINGICIDKDRLEPVEEIAGGQVISQQKSILRGVDALGSTSPHSSPFDPLSAFDLNINNQGSKLDLND